MAGTVQVELTCPEEHDVVLAILGHHVVHYNLGEPVVHIDPLEGWASRGWVHSLVHQRVPPDEADDVVGEVSGGLDQRVVGLAGALSSGCKEKDMSCTREPTPPSLAWRRMWPGWKGGQTWARTCPCVHKCPVLTSVWFSSSKTL